MEIKNKDKDKDKIKTAFVGFGEVNTPKEIIIKKCGAALGELKNAGLEPMTAVYPITDIADGSDTDRAIRELEGGRFDTLILCVAGWIPSHAVIKIADRFRHLPMALWGLCGWYEEGRLVTTADQAGTSALRQAMADLGYTFKYIYDMAGLPSRAPEIAAYCRASSAAVSLRGMKVGMMGYRDMNLYGTLYDGVSLKKTAGVEIESFDTLEVERRFLALAHDRKKEIIDKYISRWRFLGEPDPSALDKAAGYYLAVSDIARERGYGAVSLKDVDGMKALLGFPPAPVFMLLADIDGMCVVPENDSLGCVTQLMIKALTGQCGCYLEFYEFFADRVLAGVPDFIPAEVTDGETLVMPAAFGALSQGLLNVSKVKEGALTLCRLVYSKGVYRLHCVTGEGIRPRAWEEAGWTRPAPQLPGLEILLADVPAFTDKVASQHYFISYGDNTAELRTLCDILGVEMY